MYTLKLVAQRGALFGAAAALVATMVMPAATVLANNALNPLTERSLLLSSSAPGYTDTDGSGNSETSPNANNESYAPPGSGPNGKKTGETFTFKVSTDSTELGTDEPLKGISFQYCTTAAGLCRAPGNNAAGESNAVAHAKTTPSSDLEVVGEFTEGAGVGQFQVFMDGTATTGWTMKAKNAEDVGHSQTLTGKDNFIYLSNSTGIEPESYDGIEVVFRASTGTYITNPGFGSFFVKINTYSTEAGVDAENFVPTTDANLIDGGVTVANVMTESIHITTKVLETMSFSVGVHNPDTETVVAPAVHGPCEAIEKGIDGTNRLQLGNEDAEYSLETNRAHTVDSYWRLSSNSSGGATVYYSGDTLRNTVGDHITPIQRTDDNDPVTGVPVATRSLPGSEQFGLAFVPADAEVSQSFLDAITGGNGRFKLPMPAPLVQVAAYNSNGGGNAGEGVQGETIDANFAFDDRSLEVPAIIAQNADAVVSCATAKMRYVANIGADTPAGVYTTKVNYLAAPQY